MTLREEVLKDSGILNEGIDKNSIREKMYPYFFNAFGRGICLEKIKQFMTWLKSWEAYTSFKNFFENEDNKEINNVFNKHTDETGKISFRDILNEIHNKGY